MLKKHYLLLISLLGSASIYAEVPIEARGLSQTTTTPTAIAVADQPSTPNNLNWELIQKNQQLENDLRVLRGKFEEQEYALDQLKKELLNRYTDLDQRLELLQKKADGDTTDDSETTADTSDSNAALTNNATATSNANAAQSPSTETKNTPSDDKKPVAKQQNNSNTSATNEKTVANTQQSVAADNNSKQEQAAYTVALDAYKEGGAKKAIQPMENFIKNYPKSVYRPNAYFWLAEFYLAIDPPNYQNAKKNYLVVANQYPTSSRAPRALYQLYNIAKEVDKKNDVATGYKNRLIKSYPQSEEAKYLKK